MFGPKNKIRTITNLQGLCAGGGDLVLYLFTVPTHCSPRNYLSPQELVAFGNYWEDEPTPSTRCRGTRARPRRRP